MGKNGKVTEKGTNSKSRGRTIPLQTMIVKAVQR